MLIVRYTLDRGRRKCSTGGSNSIILGDNDGISRMLVVHGCIQPLTSVEGAIRLFIRYLRVKVSPHAHLCRQLTHYTQTLDREWVPETRSLEPGIASKMSLATLVEWPSQVCTHRPSHCISSRSSEVVTRCPSWKVGMNRENPMRA